MLWLVDGGVDMNMTEPRDVKTKCAKRKQYFDGFFCMYLATYVRICNMIIITMNFFGAPLSTQNAGKVFWSPSDSFLCMLMVAQLIIR